MFNEENKLAYSLALKAHGSQLYGTEPYVQYHVMGVVDNIQSLGFSKAYITVALLHDVLEDTKINKDTLSQLFDSSVVKSVVLLTRTPNNKEVYLDEIKKDKVARLVKIADATFNMNENLRHHNLNRANHYSKIISYLTSK